MDNDLQDALRALALMAQQYLKRDENELDHLFMSAGEHAVEVLAKHGFVEIRPRGGCWTKAGLQLLRR